VQKGYDHYYLARQINFLAVQLAVDAREPKYQVRSVEVVPFVREVDELLVCQLLDLVVGVVGQTETHHHQKTPVVRVVRPHRDWHRGVGREDHEVYVSQESKGVHYVEVKTEFVVARRKCVPFKLDNVLDTLLVEDFKFVAVSEGRHQPTLV